MEICEMHLSSSDKQFCTGTCSFEDMKRFAHRILPNFTTTELEVLLNGATEGVDEGLNYRSFVMWLLGTESGAKRASKVVRSDTLTGNTYKGLSVTYLSTTFLQEVHDAMEVQPALVREHRLGSNGKPIINVYDIESNVIRKKGMDVVCPRDGKPGAAYVDCVRAHEGAGYSTHMLSYSWGYSIEHDIVDGLNEFCLASDPDLDPKQTIFWVCCLCINQHRVKEQVAKNCIVPFNEFQAEFEQRVQGIGHVVALMSPWNAPRYTTRVWCNLEMYTAVAAGCKISVAMPSAEAAKMRGALISERDNDIEQVWRAFQHIKIEEAEASVKEDKEEILKIIDAGIGFRRLNNTVAKHLQEWIVASCDEFLERHLSEKSFDQEHLALVCGAVGELLTKMGKLKRAKAVLSWAIAIREREGTLDTALGAALMTKEGTAHGVDGDAHSATRSFEGARAILERLGQLKSIDGAEVVLNIGISRGKLGDVEGELEAYELARHIHVETGTLETPQGAHLLRMLGVAKGKSGDSDGEFAAYSEAKRIRAATDSLQSPDGAALLRNIGNILGRRGQAAEALEVYAEAMGIRERTCTLRTRGGAALLRDLGVAKGKRGDLPGELEAYRLSRDIYVELDALDTPDGQETLESLAACSLPE